MLDIIEIHSAKFKINSLVHLEIEKIEDNLPIFKKVPYKTGFGFMVGEGDKTALIINISDERQSVNGIQPKELEEMTKSPEEQQEMDMKAPDIKTPMVSGPSLDR